MGIVIRQLPYAELSATIKAFQLWEHLGGTLNPRVEGLSFKEVIGGGTSVRLEGQVVVSQTRRAKGG